MGVMLMKKLAGLTSYTWKRMNDAIKREKDLNRTMIELGRHFAVDPDDTDKLLKLKRDQHPRTKVLFIDESDSRFYPAYIPQTDTVITYREPWSFLHEYGHAYERADLGDKIRRLLPIKHKLPKREQYILDSYIQEGYLSGDIESQRVGEFLDRIIKDTKTRKEGDVWRLTEEMRANARAYNDAKTMLGKDTADKVMQPLSISDVTYAGEFYPEEMNKLLNRSTKNTIESARSIGIFNMLKHKIKKVNEGMPEEWEKLRT
jgi:hypothetical protein